MSGFFDGGTELSEEEVDAIILATSKRIKKYGMEMAAIMALESFKPLVYVGGELTRLTLSPFFPIFGSNIDMWGEKLINVFEDRENIDKLILLLEKMSTEEYESKEKDPIEKVGVSEEDQEYEETKNEKSGWRHWLPFD
jgi:hypothetical protein